MTDEQIEKMVRDFQSVFRCQKCGTCCKEGIGISLLPGEIRKLKTIVPDVCSVSWSKFKDNHTTAINGVRLMEMPCPFYKQERCVIYNDRPAVCRLYPMAITADKNIRLSKQCTYVKALNNKIADNLSKT